MQLKCANKIVIPERIISKISNLINNSNNLSDLPFDDISSIVPEFFNSAIKKEITEELNNNEGIIFFDYQLEDNLSFQRRVMLSTAIFHFINSGIYNPVIEPKNKTPFATFKSSADKIDSMKKAGVPFYSPDTKLGYHNDVFVEDGKYSMPKYVSIVNLFIGYKEPGNFYYININDWDDLESIFNRGLGKKFKFKPAPVIYETKLAEYSKANNVTKEVLTPAFWENENGEKFVFSNGELLDIDNSNLILELKDSLINNSTKIAIEQKINRVILFRNDRGFHSRDIFEKQQVFSGTTRLFLRGVSEESIMIPNIEIA